MGHPSGSPRLPRMGDRVPRVTRMGGNPKGSPSPGKDGGGVPKGLQREEGGVWGVM